MALHGDVRVNNRVIASWEAKRTTPKPAEVNTYECEVVWFERGEGREREVKNQARFLLEHVYEDGALCLASEVLARAYSIT